MLRVVMTETNPHYRSFFRSRKNPQYSFLPPKQSYPNPSVSVYCSKRPHWEGASWNASYYLYDDHCQSQSRRLDEFHLWWDSDTMLWKLNYSLDWIIKQWNFLKILVGETNCLFNFAFRLFWEVGNTLGSKLGIGNLFKAILVVSDLSLAPSKSTGHIHRSCHLP